MREELIKIENLSVKYGAIEALRDLNFNILKGEFVGIVGPNGGGKSTLLKSIIKLVKPYKGSIKYCNNNPNLKKSKMRIGYVPQISDINRIFPITVKEVVLTAKLPLRKSYFHRYTEEDIKDVEEILAKVNIEDIAERQISDLSGGEFQKMLIARALALNPQVLLLDEPTAMVDAKSQKQIYNLIKRISNEITIILVTHHVQDMIRYADKLIYLEKNIIAEGDPEDVYRYAFLKPVGNLNKRNHHKAVKRV